MRTPRLLVALLLLTLGCGESEPDPPSPEPNPASARTWEDAQPATAYTSVYPKDTTPPAGTRYPCAFTPLPPTMDGIPPHHHPFLDACLALVVEAIHARLTAERALADARRQKRNDEAAARAYETTIDALVPRLAALTPPSSLASLPAQISEAITLQKQIYASALRGAGLDRPRHQRSSGLLHTVWNTLDRRFGAMSKPVEKSIFHHFCALDISGATAVFETR